MFYKASKPDLRLTVSGEKMNKHLEIGKVLFNLALYYSYQLTEPQLALYVQDLIDMDFELLVKAVRLYTSDAKNEKFPLPAKLKCIVQVTDEQKARDAASRIISAIAKVGPYQGNEAKETMGELAWAIVQANGGWMQICQVESKELGIMSSQWRELGISILANTKLGMDRTQGPALGLTKQEPVREFKSITEMMEVMTKKFGPPKLAPSETDEDASDSTKIET